MSSAPAFILGFENAVEQREPIPLRVRGTIPSWLRGSLYRTGPGVFRIPSVSAPDGVVNIQHWFDGPGMHHHFEILPDGTVQYNSRFSAEGQVKAIATAGVASQHSFGQGIVDPCKRIFDRFFTEFSPPPAPVAAPRTRLGPSDVNVSVTLTPNMPGFSGHSALPAGTKEYVVAKTDGTLLQLLKADTLDPLAMTTYKELNPRLAGDRSAAHSCRDHRTGEFFNFVQKVEPSVYMVFKLVDIPNDAAEPAKVNTKVDILAEITDAPAAYLHSFALTEKYVILCVWQADFDISKAATLKVSSTMGTIKEWNPDRSALLYVIDRNGGGLISKYQTPPFFCFHTLNAYDSSEDVVIDLSAYDDHSILWMVYLENLRDLNEKNQMVWGCARRFVLEGVARAGGPAREPKVVHWPHAIELATVHPARYHKPYRYAYGISKLDSATHHTFVDGLIKLDMSDPAAPPQRWHVPALTPGEPIFVPRPGGEIEDDGVLLSVAFDAETARSALIVLDAQDMTEVARAEMDRVFPYGFHGAFVNKM